MTLPEVPKPDMGRDMNPKAEDYTVLAEKAGIAGKRGRDVEASIKAAARKFGLVVKNPPGSIIETAHGSYQVQRNGTLLALKQDSILEAEIAEVMVS